MSCKSPTVSCIFWCFLALVIPYFVPIVLEEYSLKPSSPVFSTPRRPIPIPVLLWMPPRVRRFRVHSASYTSIMNSADVYLLISAGGMHNGE